MKDEVKAFKHFFHPSSFRLHPFLPHSLPNLRPNGERTIHSAHQ
jgi:hypothetical protein